MKTILLDQITGNKVPAVIFPLSLMSDSDLQSDWAFNWVGLMKGNAEAFFYGIKTEAGSGRLEGLLMLQLVDQALLFMTNIEVHPEHVGKNGRLDRIAGSLIAFACLQSFKLGTGDYHGFLSFKSKHALISLYREKYGAKLAVGQSMFFDPEAGKKLIRQYLGMDTNLSLR